jgi:hypothetical protein
MVYTTSALNRAVRSELRSRIQSYWFLLILLVLAAPAQAATTVTLEAESGSLTAPMEIDSGPTSSGNQFVEVPEGSGNNYNPSTYGGPGQVSFSINIPQSKTYALWARTLAPTGGSDSFFVTRNGTLLKDWLVPQSTTWKWNKISNVSLAAGTLNLAFRQREDGTKLDQVLLTDDLNLVPGTGNQPPSVNAGPNLTVTLPNSATLNATVGDDGLPSPPASVTTTWSKVSGPGTVTFGDANAVDTTATFSASGTYVLRLTANDGALSSSDDVTVTANASGGGGGGGGGPFTVTLEAESGSLTPPMVIGSGPTSSGNQFVEVPEGSGNNYNPSTYGGPGQVSFAINIPQSKTYALWARTIAPSGGSDSFYVTRNGNLLKEWFVPLSTTWKWNKISNVSLAAGTLNLAFRQREDGTKLDQVLLTDDLNLVPGTGNQPPSVNAGSNLTATLTNPANLNGTVSDDGLPNPPGSVTTSWTKQSGPGTVTFGNANAADTTASFSATGTYVLRLTASDSVLSSSDDVTITVSTGSGGTGSDFTIIALPDTQFYSRDLSPIFSAQTQWIVNNKALRNIVYVAHLGDCVESGNSFTAQWDHADEAMSLIENPNTTGLLHGIPYGVAVGNHDQSPNASPDGNSTQLYNTYFGTSRFSGRNYYGGHFGSNNDNHFSLFSAGGMDFIVVYLEFDSGANPSVLAWADELLKTHVDRRAIIVSHYITEAGNPAPFGVQGQAIYETLKGNANLFLMLAGHRPEEGRRTDILNGNTVHTLMSDYQGRANGGDGWLRILEFSPANNQIRVRTYSPTLNQFETDANSQFTLTYDMTPTSNVPPVTRVGPDQEITLPNSASLTGTVSDDGLPSSPGALTTTWSKVSGPGTVTFGNPNARNTTASFSQPGPYLLQLTADDGEKKSSADVMILVNPQTPQSVMLSVEAETGALTAPMVRQSSSAASGGQFVVVPEGTGNNFNDSTNGGPGQVRLSLNVPQGGNYALWARTTAANGNSDSFYVMGNGTLIRKWTIWPNFTGLKWNKVAEVFVGAGTFNVDFRHREDGTQLDSVLLTNDLQFVP